MRFYGFIRVSSKGQKDKYSPKNQQQDLERFVETWQNGPHSIVHIAPVIERATSWERVAWGQAIAEGISWFRTGKVEAFLFPRVDRESRNEFASIPILRQAIDAGVKIYFAQERLYLDPHDAEPIDRYLDEVRDARAYVRKMVKITKPGRISRARDDQKHPSNTKMFSFNLIDGKRVPNQAEAAALRQAAEVALKEGRPGPAARWLNSQGFQTIHGKPFSPVTLGGKGGLFRNRALVGETTIQFKEETVIIHHEPILDMDTFEALQIMLNERRLRASRSDVFYALSGIIFCRCGTRFEPTKIQKNRYYRCKACCGEKHWRRDDLEWEVNEAFGRYLARRDSLRDFMQLAQQSEAKLRQDLLRAKAEKEHTEGKWMMLLKKELAGEFDGYPRETVESQKDDLRAKTEILKVEETRLAAELEALPKVDPAEVERALNELAEPWQMANTGGYGMRYPMSWERVSVVSKTWNSGIPCKLSEEQAHLLRETLLQLNCRITIRKHDVFISGKLPLGISAKEGASVSLYALE